MSRVAELSPARGVVGALLLVLFADPACKKKVADHTAPADSAEQQQQQQQEEARRATDARIAKELADGEATRAALKTLGARYRGILAAMDKAARAAPFCSPRTGDASATAMTVDEQYMTPKGTPAYLGLLSPAQHKGWYTPFEDKDRRSRDYDPAKARAAAEKCVAQRWLVVLRIVDHQLPTVTGDKKFRAGTMNATGVLFDDTRPVCRVVASAKNAPDVEVLTFGGAAGFPEGRLENDLERQLRKAVEKKMVTAKSIAGLDPLD